MQELDDVIEILEAQIPANPNSPANVKLANALEKDIKKYFANLESMMPDFSEIYYRYVSQE